MGAGVELETEHTLDLPGVCLNLRPFSKSKVLILFLR